MANESPEAGEAHEASKASERVPDGEHLPDGEHQGEIAEIIPFPSDAAADDADRDVEHEPDPRLRDLVGEVLRDERTAQGRTLADVAKDAAVSLPYLSEIERGRKEVSSDVLDAVIRSLGLDLAEVLERALERLRPGQPYCGTSPRLLLAA